MERPRADIHRFDYPVQARLRLRLRCAYSSAPSVVIGAFGTIAPSGSNFVSIDTSNKSETADAMIAAVNSIQTDPSRISKTTLLSVQRNDAGAEVEQRYEMNTRNSGKDGAEH